MFKGKLLRAWGKKMAVAVQTRFFEQLLTLDEVPAREAELAWLLYDLRYEPATSRYRLHHVGTKYTQFQATLETITTPAVGDVSEFLGYLTDRICRKQMAGTPMASSLEPTVEPLPSDITESAR